MTVSVDEFRRRLDVPAELIDDALLLACLEVAAESIEPWKTVDADLLYPASVTEWTYQLAVKVWDTGTKGVTSLDAVGDFMMPAPSASQSMIRSTFGAAGPALKQGGLTV